MIRLILTTILFSISTLLFSQKEINKKISLEPLIGIGVSSMRFTPGFTPNIDLHYKRIDFHKDFIGYIGSYLKKPLSTKSYLKIGLTIGIEKFTYQLSTVPDKKSNIIDVHKSDRERERGLLRLSLPLLYEFYFKESLWFFSAGISGNLSTGNLLRTQLVFPSDEYGKVVLHHNFMKRLSKNASILVGVGKKINIDNTNSAFLVSLKSHYFIEADYLRFFKDYGNNFIFNLEIGYDF